MLNNRQEHLHPGRENSDLTSNLDAMQTLVTEEVSENETAAVATTTNGVPKENKENTTHPRIAIAALNFQKRTEDEKTLLIESTPRSLFGFLIVQV